MNRHALTLALALLPAAALAQPQDYVVRGPNLSGKAVVETVERAEDVDYDEAHVQVTFHTYEGGVQSEPYTYDGWARILSDGSLQWDYRLRDDTPERTGAIHRLEGTSRQGRAGPSSHMVRSLLSKKGDELSGDVAGHSQVWAPAPKAEGLVVLMIPGLSTNGWNRFMNLPYFNANRDAMRAQGLEVRRIGTTADGSVDPSHAFKTENSVSTNAGLIAAEVRAEAAFGNKVILFAHSKGATDATAAVTLHPDIQPHVAGLVAVQPVYTGSPVADLVTNRWTVHAGTKLTSAWGAVDSAAVFDLSSARRQAFVAANPFPTDKIPTVVLRSTFNRNKLGIYRDRNGRVMTNAGKLFFQGALRTNQAVISAVKGKANDGMVTIEGQTIPGATHIDKDDLDHFEPGLAMVSRHSPAALTTEAMDTLFGLMAQQQTVEETFGGTTGIPRASELVPGEEAEEQESSSGTFDWLDDIGSWFSGWSWR